MLRLVLSVSALIAGASLALEVIGLLREDKITIQVSDRSAIIGSMPHHLWILLDGTDTRRLIGLSWDSAEAIPTRAIYLEPRAERVPGTARPFYDIAIPYWLIFLLTAPWSAWWLVRQRRLTARRLAGLCQHCGYDLRESPDRCPECGAARDLAQARG
jgi:hypothetical protein